MADASDVEQALADAVAAILYPGGNADVGSSVCGVDARIMRGAPTKGRLDTDLAAGLANISVITMPGLWREAPFWMDRTVSVPPPPPTIAAVAGGNRVTFSGTPALGQLVGIAVGQTPFSYAVQANDTLTSIANALAAMIAGTPVTDDTGAPLTFDDGTPFLTGPAVSVVGNDTLTTDAGAALTADDGSPLLADQAGGASPPVAVTLTVLANVTLRARVGAFGLTVTELRRQQQAFGVTIWAPTPAARDALASAVDAGLAAIRFLPMPDYRSARLRGHGTRVDDVTQKENLWVRHFTYTVEYATTSAVPSPEALWISTGVNNTVSVTA